PAPTAPSQQPVVPVTGGKIDRREIAAIVDRFLAGRGVGETSSSSRTSQTSAPTSETEAGSMYAGPSEPRVEAGSRRSNGESASRASSTAPPSSANGHQATDFVSEDDVRRAIQKGEKIYINAKTIITPAARDIGEPAEVFAKV
ncbi:MAG: hypothetical protein ACRD6N_05285, partial [Pyrinomonadaceae bacterium]